MRRPRHGRWRSILLWTLGGLGVFLGLVAAGARVADEPLRRRVEAGMNAALTGYTVRIGTLRFHPFNFSLDLVDGVLVQQANPDPPVASIPRLHASVEWTALLRGHVVADFRFDRPVFHLDLRKARHEATDRVPVQKKGWQEAALAMYPLKINLLRLSDAEITYAEEGPLPPVRLTHLDFRAGNIRNAHSRKGVYPSDIHLHATLADTAQIRVDGDADFFSVPTPGVKTHFDLGNLRLDYLEALLHHYNVTIHRGTLSAQGDVEYAPTVRTVTLADVRLDGADLDYVRRSEATPPPAEKVQRAAAKVTQQPSAIVRADSIRIARSWFTYANETTSPPYRLFVGDCEARVHDFSNVKTGDQAPAGKAEITGKFMGSGDTRVDATFRPQRDRTDFHVDLRIENTDVRALNPLWEAYGKFDVEQGSFSLYSEIGVEHGEMRGYVKPIFRELKIFSPSEEAGVGKKAYEAVVGGVTSVLTNRPHEQVATATDLSGRLEDPHASLLQVAGNLVRNAFFKAILPGLRREGGD
jgi:uncharacterized protein DUF748